MMDSHIRLFLAICVRGKKDARLVGVQSTPALITIVEKFSIQIACIVERSLKISALMAESLFGTILHVYRKCSFRYFYFGVFERIFQ